LSSYIGAFRFLKHAKEMAQEGYEKVRVLMTSILRLRLTLTVPRLYLQNSDADNVDDRRH
jgi:hypothetical protein